MVRGMGPVTAVAAGVLSPILLGYGVQVAVDGPAPRTGFVLLLILALGGGVTRVREHVWVRYPPAPPPR